MGLAAEQFNPDNVDVMSGFDPTTGEMSSLRGMPMVTDPGDEKLWVKFAKQSHFNDVKSREEQRPCFEMRDYVTIMVPGDQTNIVNRPIRESDKFRFPKQWAAYQNGQSQEQGYPLTEWAQVSRAQCDELAYFKIKTVESLAHLPDNLAQKFPGISQLRDKARAYLEERKTAAPVDKLRGEIAKRDETINAMQAQMLQMQEQLITLQEQAAKKAK